MILAFQREIVLINIFVRAGHSKKKIKYFSTILESYPHLLVTSKIIVKYKKRFDPKRTLFMIKNLEIKFYDSIKYKNVNKILHSMLE